MATFKRPRANFSALVAQRNALAWKAADWRHLANRCADQPELVAKALAKAAAVQAQANALTSALRTISLNRSRASASTLLTQAHDLFVVLGGAENHKRAA